MERLPSKHKVLFFIPESDDLVDPGYDFLNDTYSDSRATHVDKRVHDVYMHEIFERPPFDGILVSRSNIDKPTAEEIAARGGIHSYLRLPTRFPVMGDCGAFQYLAQEKPPYACAETCRYYDRLGFDYGVTVDHLITEFDERFDGVGTLFSGEPNPRMRERYTLTMRNAHRMRDYAVRHHLRPKLIGVAQGWSPLSYSAAVKELATAGFDYIALGGLARARTEAIVSVLKAVRRVVPTPELRLHVFGVARTNILDQFSKYDVSSCDSAAPLMQAFKSATDNYYMPGKNYTAVRIPAVSGDTSPKVARLLRSRCPDRHASECYRRESERLSRLEKVALLAVRAYAAGTCSHEDAMRALMAYEDEFGEGRRYYGQFAETLRDRPWEHCPCQICRDPRVGIEVILMRGNNRNRRRGFHNVYTFYRQFLSSVGRTSELSARDSHRRTASDGRQPHTRR